MSKETAQQNTGTRQALVVGTSLCLTLSTIFGLPEVLGQVSPPHEYRQKAAVLANLPKFVEWPVEAFVTTEAPLELCVYGSFPFGTSLAEAVRGQVAHRRRMELRWVKQESELRSCHVLFLSGLDRVRVVRALEMVRGGVTLTVGESEEFLKVGGVVNLVSENGHTYFDVSLEAAAQGRLRISSKLLNLARHVVRPQCTAKPEPVA